MRRSSHMPANYRMVLFVPDPFTGARFPIAALVRDGQKISVVQAPHLPCPKCLGGESAAALVQLVLEDLAGAAMFDVLPESVGPQIILGDARSIPASVGVNGESISLEGGAIWVERVWKLWGGDATSNQGPSPAPVSCSPPEP